MQPMQPTNNPYQLPMPYQPAMQSTSNASNYHLNNQPMSCGTKDIKDCSARLPDGGLPTIELAYKLEETDMGFNNVYDYATDLYEQQDEYMRNAVTDRNCDEPAFNDDQPNYNATRNSGALNTRYNGTRGTTDYLPAHPEIFIGDMGGGGTNQPAGFIGNAEELPIDVSLAEMKSRTAAIVDTIQYQFQDSSDQQVPEQAWADPEISYAKKDMQKWYSHIYNKWEWPSFINHQSGQQRLWDPSTTARERKECMIMGDDAVQTGPELRDEYAKIIKPRAPAAIDAINGKYVQTNPTNYNIPWSTQDENRQRMMINETDPALARIAARDCLLTQDETKTGYNRRMNLAINMKIALQNQDTNDVLALGTSADASSKKKSNPLANPRQHVSNIAKIMLSDNVNTNDATQSRITTSGGANIAPSKDHIKPRHYAQSSAPGWLLDNIREIKYAAMGATDQAKCKRNIQYTKTMHDHIQANNNANRGLRPNNATTNIQDVEHTTRLQTSAATHHYVDPVGAGGHDMTRNLTHNTITNVTYDDTQYSKHNKTLMPTTIPDMYHAAELDDETFQQQDDFEKREQNWCRH
jgi:hypothetical protein